MNPTVQGPGRRRPATKEVRGHKKNKAKKRGGGQPQSAKAQGTQGRTEPNRRVEGGAKKPQKKKGEDGGGATTKAEAQGTKGPK